MTRVVLGALGGMAACVAIGLFITGFVKWMDFCQRISGEEDWGFFLFMLPFAALIGALAAVMMT